MGICANAGDQTLPGEASPRLCSGAVSKEVSQAPLCRSPCQAVSQGLRSALSPPLERAGMKGEARGQRWLLSCRAKPASDFPLRSHARAQLHPLHPRRLCVPDRTQNRWELGPQKSHAGLPQGRQGRVSVWAPVPHQCQASKAGDACCRPVQRPSKYPAAAQPRPPAGTATSAPRHPAEAPQRHRAVTRARHWARGRGAGGAWFPLPVQAGGLTAEPQDPGAPHPPQQQGLKGRQPRSLGIWGGRGNPRRRERTPAQLLKWVFPLQGGSEDTGSHHHEEAPLWSPFLGTEQQSQDCHRPERHRVPAGTEKNKPAVSTGHSPVPSAPKHSCPRSCKKQGRAPTWGAPSAPRQLPSQLPAPQTRARARLHRTGVQRDETWPLQNPSPAPRNAFLSGSEFLAQGAITEASSAGSGSLGQRPAHIFPAVPSFKAQTNTPAHTWHQAGTARPFADTGPWPSLRGGLGRLWNGQLRGDDAARRLQGGSGGSFDQRPTPVTPWAGLLNSRKERCDVEVKNPGVEASGVAVSGEREPQRGGVGGHHTPLLWGSPDPWGRHQDPLPHSTEQGQGFVLKAGG